MTPRPPRSRGAVLLSRTALTQREIAARVGVCTALVSHWLPGHRLPSARRREQIESLFGIPASSWDVPWFAEASTLAARACADVSPEEVARGVILVHCACGGVRPSFKPCSARTPRAASR